ncbi:MAG: NlpC/P60 family protein [Ketobacteraceae bacterium]|nr:NlpC/P60 family protein [Ketobacteraceae bacterium]
MSPLSWKNLIRKNLVTGIALSLTLGLGACSTTPDVSHNPGKATAARVTSPPAQSPADIRQRLLSQYRQWKGVRYRLGGLSRQGIDCSGFVQRTFVEQLGIPVPRTTDQQARIGTPIPREDLNSGDLVFFRTGYKGRHVGIYVGDGQFLHASTSSGVMLSGLGDYYWRDRFWQARRIR